MSNFTLAERHEDWGKTNREWSDDDDYISPYDQNVYSNPASCGLRIVETTSRPNLSYEFEYVVLFEDVQNGKQYWKADAGCSCPRPFERVKSLGDLIPLKGSEKEYARMKQEVSQPRPKPVWEDMTDEEYNTWLDAN